MALPSDIGNYQFTNAAAMNEYLGKLTTAYGKPHQQTFSTSEGNQTFPFSSVFSPEVLGKGERTKKPFPLLIILSGAAILLL